MGLKRPFDAEEVLEFSFKHARQLEYSNKLTQLDGVAPYHVLQEKRGVMGKDMSDFYGSECEDGIEGDTWEEDVNHLHKDFETNAPFSWITPSSSEEDARSGGATQSSLSQEYTESDFPWRPFSPVEDVYSCLMDRSPRKRVPVGPNYQADIPECQSGSAQVSRTTFGEEEGKLMMGKCIIPMPDSDISGLEAFKTGEGRKDCLCWDKGSIRCMRQHIMEAREDLVETVGYEKFVKLGFCKMGEEVARRWSEEEEDLFHEVVYSNPVSVGWNFWKHLKVAFPSRTMGELASYYFNVFVLRRRAVQNRSKSLDIDSDDDEWHVDYDNSYGAEVPDEDEDSAIESPFTGNTGTEYKKRSPLEEDGEDSNSSDDDDNDNANGCQGDSRDGSGDVTQEDTADDSRRENIHMVNIEDDSCMSFEFQSNTIYSHSPVGTEEKPDLGKSWRHRFDGCNDLVNQLYCDAGLPDPWAGSVDLLPTSNIIEEIFGQGSWDSNPTGK